TILANLVGRSVVSAITHTPASGPLGPRTTPPRSASPMTIPEVCCARRAPMELPIPHAIAIAATPAKKALLILILRSLEALVGVGGPLRRRIRGYPCINASLPQ